MDATAAPVHRWWWRWLLLSLLVLSAGVLYCHWMGWDRPFVYVPVRLQLLDDILGLQAEYLAIPDLIDPNDFQPEDKSEARVMLEHLAAVIYKLCPALNIFTVNLNDIWAPDSRVSIDLCSKVRTLQSDAETAYSGLSSTGG